jgi:FkbM family methyltransferase
MPNSEKNSTFVQVTTPAGTFRGFADDVITDHLVDFGAHTRNELAMVLAHIDESDVCVDLGAHIGTYAIPIARKLGSGRVLAVEGSPTTFSLLQMNVAENGLSHKIETACAIVGNGSGRPLRRVEVEGHTGASHYVFDDEAVLPGQDAYAILCARGFDRPDFVKIDIEGMELLVLKSLEPLIFAHRPKLYIEMNEETFARFGTTYDDVQEFLSLYNYKFFRNTGARNSDSDIFNKTQLNNLKDGGRFYDLLALPA